MEVAPKDIKRNGSEGLIGQTKAKTILLRETSLTKAKKHLRLRAIDFVANHRESKRAKRGSDLMGSPGNKLGPQQ